MAPRVLWSPCGAQEGFTKPLLAHSGTTTHAARAQLTWDAALRTRPVTEVGPGAVAVAVEAR